MIYPETAGFIVTVNQIAACFKIRHLSDRGNQFFRFIIEHFHRQFSFAFVPIDKIERQAKKQKTKRKVHKSGASAPRATAGEAGEPSQPEIPDSESSGPPSVVRTERVAAKPMSVEEAVMQLEVSANEFLVFRNSVNETVNVLYRRKDGNYGLIEPDVRAR